MIVASMKLGKMPLPIVASIAALVVASLACYTQAPATTTPTPGVEVVEAEQKPATTATTSPPETFTVVAESVYLRNAQDQRIGHLYKNATIACSPDQAGWCHLGDSGIRVWAGCLDPNPQSLGCEDDR